MVYSAVHKREIPVDGKYHVGSNSSSSSHYIANIINHPRKFPECSLFHLNVNTLMSSNL